MNIVVPATPRIVMDTNVLYSALRSNVGASHLVLRAVRKANAKLLVNQTILHEYEEILKRYAQELSLKLADVDLILDALCNIAELHGSTQHWTPRLNDPADEAFAQLAFEAHADYLVTHNVRHFRPVAAQGLNVLAPKQILGIIKS
jgi:putative PIN family toxin of toxin-antitoxin system